MLINGFKGSVIELQSTINRENLRYLMRSFYERAVEHERLAPFFLDEIGHDLDDEEWTEHIELLADFWLAKMLGEDTYYGNFVGAHVKMPRIHKEIVDDWLLLFSVTVVEVYDAVTAERFKKKALQLSKQFLTSSKKI